MLLAKILTNNSYCELQNFPTAVLDSIKKELTYKNEELVQERIGVLRAMKYAYYARKTGRYSPYLMKKLGETGTDINSYINQLKGMLYKIEQGETVCLVQNNRFPTGLLEIVKNVLTTLDFRKFSILDSRQEPEMEHRFKWKQEPQNPRYYQTEVSEILDDNERGVIESCVASGKTYMMKDVVFKHRVTSLVVVPSAPLLVQTSEDFMESFGKSIVQTVDAQDIKQSRKKLKPIRICTIHALASLKEAGLLSKLLDDVNLIIFDEFHHAASKSYTDLLDDIDHIYYRYGFTGTFLRNDSKTLEMWGVLGNRLYHYPAAQGIKDGFITKPRFEIHSLPGVSRLNYQKEYSDNYCGSKVLIQKIKDIVDKVPKGKQVLILVDRKEESGEVIHKFLKHYKIPNTYISGDDKKDVVRSAIEDFNDKKINILVGSTVIGEGIDLYSTDVLILATGGKSPIKIIQAIGRAIRLALGKELAWIHDFRFTGTKFLERHLGERLDIYRGQFDGDIFDV